MDEIQNKEIRPSLEKYPGICEKSGKSLCTIYPNELYFAVLVVVGRKEREQKWLTIDLEDKDEIYRYVLRLIQIRRCAALLKVKGDN